MPKKLTNKTNLIVKETGRPVFKLDGENVSEKSATIKVDDFYVNLPSIHGNMKYNEDELYDMLMNDEIKATSVHKKHSDAIKAAKERSKNLTIIERNNKNKGGIMEQQMSLFEEGGMKDDGLDRDPVSGNEIPPGSLAKEVRDDIPAQLSDGEYVVPADVVQYYGVKFFEDLRAEAKRGLAEMEATGRIGGEPVEVDMTMIAFGQADKKKKEKKAEGGVIYANKGVLSKDMQEIEKARTFDPLSSNVTGFGPYSALASTGKSSQYPVDTSTVFRTYYGPNNETMSVPGTIDANGNWNPLKGYEDFASSEKGWTTTRKQIQQPKKERSGPSALELEAQRRQNEYALGVSAKRLGIPLEQYKKLSFGKRFKLIGQEMKVISGGKADPKIVKGILDGKDDGFGLTDLISFVFNPIGSVIKLATSFIAGADIGDSPASNVKLKNQKNLNKNQAVKKETNQEAIDRLKKQAADRRSKDSAEDRRQRKADIERATKKSVAEATTDDVSKAAQKKGGGAATISTGEMIKEDKQTGFESRFYKKGGLIQRPKRKNKK